MAIISITGVIGSDYTYKNFITDYANAGNEQIKLLINSPGGYMSDGEAIAEFITKHSTRFDSVINTGDVASIAASIFLSLPYEKRFFDPSKGVALIHNPYLADTEGLDTTASGLAQLSDDMLVEEKKIKNFIVKQTGADADVVEALMKINDELSEEQLNSIKFAQIVKPVAFKAVAFLKQNKNNNMKDEELKKQLEEQKTILDKIVSWLSPKNKIVALILTDANGGQIEFPEVAEGGTPVVGDKTTAPDGEIVMADGSIIVVAGGVITEIKPVPVENEEMEALKAELATLKTENEALKSAQAQIETVKAEVVALRAKIKSQIIDLNPEEKTEKKVEQPTKFTYNGRKK